MKNYFYLQLKRVAKILPFVIAITVALLIGLAAILYGMMDLFVGSDSNTRFTVAVSGDTDNSYVDLGLTAMQTFDETRFSMEIIPMEEEKARESIENGTISAYIVIPEGFIDNALSGQIDPITFVTSPGMEGINGLLKREITELITEMVVYSQKGSYGLHDAMLDNGFERKEANDHLNKISIKYADLIVKRNKLYTTNELGVSDGLSTPEYYVCAILILLLVLIGLPFAAVYIKRDYSFNQLLVSRGYSTGRQILFEYLAHLIAMMLLLAVMLGTVSVSMKFMPSVIDQSLVKDMFSGVINKIVPIVIMLSAFNIMMFELSSNIVSGLLLHFFAAIGLCYVSGCMYPIYAFPNIIEKIANFLPTGIARGYLASSFTYDDSMSDLVGLVIYSLVFFGIAWFMRYNKTVKIRR